MSTRLQQEIERWETELRAIAESSESDDWFVEERRLAEATHTITAYRGRILPNCPRQQPYDAIVAAEITHLVDRLEDLRDDLLRTVHPAATHESIIETLAALRALAHLALRFERSPEGVR